MNTQEDPFASARPKTNQKPAPDSNDPFFNARPKSYQEQFKQPEPKAPMPQDMPGESGSIWDKFGRALSFQSQLAGPKPEAVPAIAKATASGATFGFSEKIPGMKKEEEYPEIGDVYGTLSSFPAIGLINKPFKLLTKLAEKSPVAAKGLTALADMIGWGGTGASVKTLEDLSHGKSPSAEDVLVHGVEWAALDGILKGALGLGEKFTNYIMDTAGKNKQVPWETVNDFINQMKEDGIDLTKEGIGQDERVTAKVLSILEKEPELSTKIIQPSKKPILGEAEETAHRAIAEVKPESKLDLATKKIEPKQFKKIEESSPGLAKPYQPNEINAEKAIADIERSVEEGRIAQTAERAATEKELGENVQKDIEETFKKEEERYAPLYKDIEKSAETITHKPEQVINIVENIVSDINKLKTRPEGYAKVINTLNDVLSDLGLKIHEFEGKVVVRDASGKAIQLKPLRFMQEIPLSKTMELARRLNKIIDYDIVGSSIKNRLKPVNKALKNEIKSVLKNHNPELESKFIQAESLYGQTAEKYGSDSLAKIRGHEAPEKIAQIINEPSTLDKLNKVLSPKQKAQVEREILEQLKIMNERQASERIRELRPHLSPKGNDIATSLLKEKAKHGPRETHRKLATGIIENLNEAFSQGKRPDRVLDLWKTKNGRKLIEESINGTPNKEEVLKYLKDQSFHDFSSSVVDKQGTIDFKKLNEYLKDPEVIQNLRDIGGEQAVTFFRSLETLNNQLKKNIKVIESLPNTTLSSKYGQEKLKKAAEKAKQPSKPLEKFKEVESAKIAREKELKNIPKEEQHLRGKTLLQKGAKSSAPLKFKLEELSEKYGISPTIKGILGTLGILKYTGATLGVIAAKVLYKLASKPGSRTAFKKVLETSMHPRKSPHDVGPFIMSLIALDNAISD